MHSQDYDWILTSKFGKGITVFYFLRCFLFHLLACVATEHSSQRVERGVENAYRAQTAILFKIEVNNSSKVIVTVSIQEKICRVSAPA